MINLRQVQESPKVKAFLKQADDNLMAIGYKEHGFRHANLAADIARNVLTHLGYSERESELGGIAGYLHDIGNTIGRSEHAQSGAVLSLHILTEMGMALEGVSQIVRAIGGHGEKEVDPDTTITAAVILGDKTDVHSTRVRSLPGKPRLVSTFTTHDRVNYACQRAFLNVYIGGHKTKG
ncbi:MAG: phosphohydrolase [bacterium]